MGPLRVLVLGSSGGEDYVRDLLVHGLESLGRHPHTSGGSGKDGGGNVENGEHAEDDGNSWDEGPKARGIGASSGGGSYLYSFGGSRHRPVASLVLPEPEHMYEGIDADDDEDLTPGGGVRTTARAGLYGNGFTYAGWLPYDDDDGIVNGGIAGASGGGDGGGGSVNDGVSVRGLIAAKYFDVVVFGSVHRGLPFLLDVLDAGYGPGQVNHMPLRVCQPTSPT